MITISNVSAKQLLVILKAIKMPIIWKVIVSGYVGPGKYWYDNVDPLIKMLEKKLK